jgi:hypothetical protein
MTDVNRKSGAYGPQLQVARMFRKTSAKGTEYFTGRWGMAKIALLKSRDVGDDGSEIWNLVLSEAPKPSGEPR